MAGDGELVDYLLPSGNRAGDGGARKKKSGGGQSEMQAVFDPSTGKIGVAGRPSAMAELNRELTTPSSRSSARREMHQAVNRAQGQGAVLAMDDGDAGGSGDRYYRDEDYDDEDYEEDPQDEQLLDDEDDPNNYDDDGIFQPKKASSRRRGGDSGGDKHVIRSLMVGIFYYGFTVLLVIGFLFYDLFVAAFGAVLLTIVLPLTSSALRCCYPKEVRQLPSYGRLLSQLALLAALCGAFGGVAGGYYWRNLHVASSGTLYTNLLATGPPVEDGGELFFANNAHVFAEGGGRNTGEGLWPVCAAPIMESEEQRTVSYWAISHGECCVKHPMSCDHWLDVISEGGVFAKYSEIHVGVHKAVRNAVVDFNFVSDPNAKYVFWGEPAVQKNHWNKMSSTFFAGSGAVALVLVALRAMKGPSKD